MENMENIGKIKLLELGALPRVENVAVAIGEDGKEIMVTPRIPYEQVLDMMQWCIDFIIGEKSFVSGPIKRIVKDFAILKWYTNIDISFMEEFHEMRDIYENYDLVDVHDIIEQVRDLINKKQLKFFEETLEETLMAIDKYRNSAKGILDALTSNAEETSQTLQTALDFLKDEKQKDELVSVMKLADELK